MVTLDPAHGLSFTVDAPEASSVEIVGFFHSWHEQRVPMHRGPDGRWRLQLDPGYGYLLFRYCIDGQHWQLEPADHGRYVGFDGIERSRIYCPPASLDPDAMAA